jgi:hypothetical protein
MLLLSSCCYFAEPNQHVLTFLHPILMFRVTFVLSMMAGDAVMERPEYHQGKTPQKWIPNLLPKL